MKLEYQVPRLIAIPGISNVNGTVHFLENAQFFPEGVYRCFWISGVKAGESRGNHAHWEESQVIVALVGKLEVDVLGLDGHSATFSLHDAGTGLFVPPLNWISIQFSSDAVLLALGNRVYSESDFIRDQDHFGSLQKGYR